MSDPSLALLYACHHLDLIDQKRDVVILGRYASQYTENWKNALFGTYFAEESLSWSQAGHTPCPENAENIADIVLLEVPQQSQEADYLIAQALRLVRTTGIVMAAAGNLSGGKTLSKRFSLFGCPIADLSKHKCRVVWTMRPDEAHEKKISEALRLGSPAPRDSDSLYTQPGVFSWGHRDIGTDILLRTLPHSLTGKGADFGCGLGEIARFILQTCHGITTLDCIDHDSRALDCCRKNLLGFESKTNFMWQDIQRDACTTHLDFIVMNPPFHTGKAEDKNLGRAFITRAFHSLKQGGVLYMVANSHLPYEDLLQSHFAYVELLTKEKGFKVFKAIR